DGIRDFHVTGVQTCALPICNTELKLITCIFYYLGLYSYISTPVLRLFKAPPGAFLHWRFNMTTMGLTLGARLCQRSNSYNKFRRSEERRVGKEWKSRWAPRE